MSDKPVPPSDEPDAERIGTEKKNNVEAIHAVERTTSGARGNVHSEADEQAPAQDAPPPFPN